MPHALSVKNLWLNDELICCWFRYLLQFVCLLFDIYTSCDTSASVLQSRTFCPDSPALCWFFLGFFNLQRLATRSYYRKIYSTDTDTHTEIYIHLLGYFVTRVKDLWLLWLWVKRISSPHRNWIVIKAWINREYDYTCMCTVSVDNMIGDMQHITLWPGYFCILFWLGLLFIIQVCIATGA